MDVDKFVRKWPPPRRGMRVASGCASGWHRLMQKYYRAFIDLLPRHQSGPDDAPRNCATTSFVYNCGSEEQVSHVCQAPRKPASMRLGAGFSSGIKN